MDKSEKFLITQSRSIQIWMGIGFVFFLFLTFISCKGILTQSYFYSDILESVFFLLGALGFLYCALNNPQTELSKTDIVIKNRVWPKEIKRREIIGYKESLFKNEDLQGSRFILKTSKGYVSFDTDEYTGGGISLGNFIKKNYTKIPDEEFKRYNFFSTIWLRGLSLFVSIALFGSFYHSQFPEVKKLSSLKITLKIAPERAGSGGNSDSYLRIFAQEYPDFIFQATGVRYEAFDTSAFLHIEEGDTVEILIGTADLQNKLWEKGEPSLNTKQLRKESVEIHQLYHNSFQYINPHVITRKAESDRKWGWVGLLFGLLFLGFTFINYHPK